MIASSCVRVADDVSDEGSRPKKRLLKGQPEFREMRRAIDQRERPLRGPLATHCVAVRSGEIRPSEA